MQASYSKIALYRTCPKQYEYAYVKELPRSISRSESYGSSVHNTLKQWGELELQYQSPVTNNQTSMFTEEPTVLLELNRETLLQFWHSNFIRSTYSSAIEANEDEQKGKVALSHFYTWWQQKKRSICTVETGFQLPLQHHVLKGRFDRIEQDEQGLHIIDFKTGSVKDTQYVDEDLQLSVYVKAAEMLFKQPVHTVSLVFINDTQTVQVDSTRSEAMLQEATDTLSVCLTNIEFKQFLPTPTVKGCTYCPYKNVCKDSIAKS